MFKKYFCISNNMHQTVHSVYYLWVELFVTNMGLQLCTKYPLHSLPVRQKAIKLWIVLNLDYKIPPLEMEINITEQLCFENQVVSDNIKDEYRCCGFRVICAWYPGIVYHTETFLLVNNASQGGLSYHRHQPTKIQLLIYCYPEWNLELNILGTKIARLNIITQHQH